MIKLQKGALLFITQKKVKRGEAKRQDKFEKKGNNTKHSPF